MTKDSAQYVSGSPISRDEKSMQGTGASGDSRAVIALYPVRHRRSVIDVSPWVPRLGRYLELVGVGSLFACPWGGVFPALLVAACCLGGSIGITAWVDWANWRVRKRPSLRFDSFEAEHRLQCVGENAELEALGELRDVFFEPVIVRAIPTVRFTSPLGVELRQFRPLALGVVLASGGAGLILSLFLISHNPLLGWLTLFATMLCVELGVVGWSGTFYRVVPGRLERLRAGIFTSRVRVDGTVNLLEATVVCRYDKGVLEFPAQGSQGGLQLIRLDGIPERHRFVKAVFMGAISTHTPPPLAPGVLAG